MKRETEDFLFTCKDCESHDLYVEKLHSVTTHLTETLSCKCGAADDGIATERRSHVVTAYVSWGPLDEEHRCEFDEGCEVEDGGEQEEDEYEVFCNKCLENAQDGDWETEQEDENDEDSYEFYVKCSGCDREIEFGWSHPDRGGRIWPSECSDFNPWMSWPEPRYVEKWKQKNWLRPDLIPAELRAKNSKGENQ